MKNNSLVLTASLLSVCVVMTGCRSKQVTVTPAQQGAVLGGAAGATAGAIWVNNHNNPGWGLNSWKGAALGAVAGAATGALIGDALDEYAYSNETGARDRDAKIDQLQRQLSAAESELARLSSQPGLEHVQVESIDGQLRFTILNEILFEPGKSELKQSSLSTLDSVLSIIENDYTDRRLAIEGHTDSDPIRHSNWKDNWELSYNRSMAVLYYFTNQRMVDPSRLRAIACGEFQPVAPNDTAANKRMNRRAVIVVMPPEDAMTVVKK